MQFYYKKKPHKMRLIIFFVLCAITINILLPISVLATEHQPIMGETIANKEEMVEYYRDNFATSYPQEYLEKNIDLENFLHIILQESYAEGVRADVVFAQLLLETDWLKFNDDGEVGIVQNNFGGLKDQEGNYLSFDSIEEGIRANVQLLKGYASSELLNQDQITFLYDLINPRGVITNVEELGNGNWSEDPEYGGNIKRYLEEMINKKKVSTPKEVLEIQSDTSHQIEWLDTLAETKSEMLPESKLNDITPVEVKTLTIDGSNYVGAKHRIRSLGTSKNGVLYQFWVKDLSTNRWTMIQDYSKSSAAWTPTKPGKYLYGVHIKDEKSNESLDTHLYKEITIKSAELKTLTIVGSGYVGGSHRIRSYGTSTNGVLYQFWIKDLSTNRWTMIQDYSKSSAPWTPTKPGKYLYGVHIKDEKSNERLDTHLYKEITIKSAEVKTLTIDGSGNVGGSYRIRSYGTSTNGVLYQFWVKDLSTNRWTMIQDYSKSSAPWTPTKAGKYLYGVHIKDEKSNERLDEFLYKQVTIEPGKVKTLSIEGPVYAKGTYRIRSYGDSTNGTLYQFWIKDLSTNKWKMIQDYSRSSAPWTPTKAGKYLYGVHIKDEKSTDRLDAHLYKEVIVRPPNVYYYTEYKDTFNEFINKQLSTGQNKIDGSGSTFATKAEIEKHSNPTNTMNLAFEPNIVKIIGDVVNIREGPSTSHKSLGCVYKNEIYDVLHISNDWYQINRNGVIGWVSGDYISGGSEINYNNITADMYQFLDLTTRVNINVGSLNNYLKTVDRSVNKVFEGQAQNFINASNKYNVNLAYLVSHAMHETGFGSSSLANGTATVNGQIVYNFFGISAYDGSAYLSGSQYAYEQGWFTQKAAIEGGASWISKNYINHSTRNQNTPYKMKWNPQSPATHQYATHVMWPTRIAKYMADIYELSNAYSLILDIPKYK